MKKITIIGGGATGTLLTVNLVKHGGVQPLEINLIEREEKIGRGIAYAAVEDFHLLNVPAAKMGAFPDDAEHFHRWLIEKNHDYAPSAFVPRRLYGEYLRELLDETLDNRGANIAVNRFDDEAVDVAFENASAQVLTSAGAQVYSDKVVLAFGNFLPPHPKSKDQAFIESANYFRNPWRADLAEKIDPADDVFIIGTGLTFADVAMTLYHNRHQGRIYGFSTRGLLPAVHELGHSYPSFADELNSPERITDLLTIVRRHIARAESNGGNWRGVIDSLRPQTQELWLHLPEAEKRYFMQHLSRYWNVARHRLPPETARILDEMQTAQQLHIEKGRLRNIAVETDGKYTVTFAADGAERRVAADAVINCIGSDSNYGRLDSKLLKNLIGKGLIKPDSLKMGLDAVPDGRIIDRDGQISDTILTVGTALKGVLWESTAMPEIRAQTAKLAQSLLAED